MDTLTPADVANALRAIVFVVVFLATVISVVASISAELTGAWQSMSDGSPNRRLSQPELRVCRLRNESTREVKALFLCAHALATRYLDQRVETAAT